MRRFAILLSFFAPLCAQQMPPSPVGYTRAREYRLQQSTHLPGTVQATRTSLVASEVGGKVLKYPVRVGDHVTKGQVLVRLNTRDLELKLQAAKAQLAEESARVKLAQRNFKRAGELFRSKVISQQQFDDTRFELSAREGRVKNLTAEIDRVKYDIERATISAPFQGVVIDKKTEVGQWLGVGDPVVELLSLEDLDVVVDVPARYYASVRLGAAATMTFGALQGRELRGTVSAIIPRADEEARTFPVRVRIPPGAVGVGVGMLAEVQLAGVTAGPRVGRTVVIVPKDAIVRNGSRLTVFVIEGEGLVKAVPVTTGAGVGDWIEVRGPITADSRVVTRGNERLRPGQKVRGEKVEYLLP